MNSSLRPQESQMQAAFKQRQQQMGVSRSSVMKEKDEELALFFELRRREKERSDLLCNSSEEFDTPIASKPGTSPMFNISATTPAPARKTGADDFLNSDNDKNDYDWLLTPPGTPLFPSLEMDAQKASMSQLDTPNIRPPVLKSRLANSHMEPAGKSSFASKQPALSLGLSSSIGGTRRPSSSGGLGSRHATPTRPSTLTTASKSSRPTTPTSWSTIPSRATAAASKTMVSTTGTTLSTKKTTTLAAKPTIPSRSSTPLSTSTARSSTPTTRPTLPSSRSISRASTPTQQPSTPSSTPSISASSVKTSSISKPTPPVISRQPIPSRGTSPTMRSRLWKPSEMLGFSLDAPPNLRTTLPERPLSANRGRPRAASAQSASAEPASSGRPRRQSCSPSRGRSSNTVHTSGSSVPAVSRGHSKVNDDVSPVVIGSKTVDRVINMRKLAPPRLDDKHSPRSNLSAKLLSPENSGFGRTLSKKSLDMAIRHMDIRRSIPGNLRPLMTNIPASSMYSVQSGP